jgi:hypothetical protein
MEGVRAEALGQTKLAFDDLVNQLYAGQDPPGVEEALESEHRTHAAFNPPVILFNNIVLVGASADLDGALPPVIELVVHAHAAQSGMGGATARLRIALARTLDFAMEIAKDMNRPLYSHENSPSASNQEHQRGAQHRGIRYLEHRGDVS